MRSSVVIQKGPASAAITIITDTLTAGKQAGEQMKGN